MSNARDQVARMLALVPYLQRGEGVPLRRLADEFGITPDQMRRDLSALWMCGLPGLGGGDLIEMDYEAFENDPDGLVRIENADYLDRPLRLGSTEASALMVGLLALRESGTTDSREVVDRVLAKLETAAADGAPVAIAAHATPRSVDVSGTGAVLTEALNADRQVRITYYVPSRDETTQRDVDPLELLERDGHEYLDAWCHLVDGRRLFRVDRIDAVERLDRTRAHADEPHRDLDAGLFEAGPDARRARLRLAPEARWVVDYHPVEAVTPLPDGAVEAVLPYGDPRWLVRLVLALAPAAQVLEPPELAVQVRQGAAAALSLYGVTDPETGPQPGTGLGADA